MKRYIISSIFTIVVLGSGLLSAIPAKKALVGVGTSPVENLVTFDKNGVHTDSETQFGGAYIWGDIIQGNDYVTAGGKIYYRINAVKDFEDESQKLEIKRAYIKVRPAGNDFFEIGLGKVYSYFLPGSYFSLAEVYTGNNRWGKPVLVQNLSLQVLQQVLQCLLQNLMFHSKMILLLLLQLIIILPI